MNMIDILVYFVPMVLIIILTQVIRNNFVISEWCDRAGEPAIINGHRWLLFLVALIPIVNLLILAFLITFILAKLADDEIEPVDKEKTSRFLKWWRK